MKSSKPDNAKRRFVLIDDDPIYRSIMLRVAHSEGIEFDVFENLDDLGSVGMLGQYEVAIVDYDLGGMSGLDIAKYLTALFRDTPMVLVSESERLPGKMGWPPSIKRFVKKSDGYLHVLNQAKKCAESRSTAP